MLNFVDNWLRPITLDAAAESVELDLPDGMYILTISDSEAQPTRWEVAPVQVESGQGWLMREAPQDWPAGSVIYCAANAVVLNGLFELLTDLMLGGNPGEPPPVWGRVFGAFPGYASALGPIGCHWRVYAYDDLVTLYVPHTLYGGQRAVNTAEVHLQPGGRLRIAGGSRLVSRARVQDHPALTATVNEEYLELSASSAGLLKMEIAAEILMLTDDERVGIEIAVSSLDTGHTNLFA